MTIRLSIRSFCALGAVFTGCGCDHAPAPVNDAATDAGPTQFRASTFNGGLAPGFMELATPRIPRVAEAVAELDTDMICLQEIWTAEAYDAVAASLQASGMETYAEDTTGENETGADRCTAQQIQPAVDCVAANCGGVAEEDVTLCAVSKCKPVAALMYLMAPKCLNCILAQPGKSVEDIRSTCVDGPGASRLYGGRNSVMLASRYPLTHREALRLPSSGANRVALIATLEGYGDTSIEVGCVHLSARAKIPPTHPGFADWDAERLAQLQMISDRLKERAAGRPVLLLGDMNFVKGDAAGLWDKAIAMGFASPAAEADPPLCSACEENLLRHGKGDSLIDHVFTRNLGDALHPVGAERGIDEPVTVTDHDGNPVVTHPSDHFAVTVTFECGGKP